MTRLTKELSRELDLLVRRKPLVVTLVPGTPKREALLALRVKGERLEYRGRFSDLYRVLALWHGSAERRARIEARKQGIPWATAKRAFLAR